ncbi:MAG: TolC family outer membrane protein [Oceanicoccus sp.]
MKLFSNLSAVHNAHFCRHTGNSYVAKVPVIFGALLLSLSVGASDEYPEADEFIVAAPVYKSLSKDSILDVYQRAKTFDAEYRQAQQKNLADVEGYIQARGRLMPELSIYAEERQSDQDIVASDIDVIGSGQSDFDTTIYGANLSQPLFDWERFMRFNQSKQERALAEVELLQSQQVLQLKVAERYLTVLAAQDNLDFSEKEEVAILAQESAAKKRYDAEVGRKVDYLEATARASSVYADKVAAKNTLDDAIEAVREVSGAGTDNYARLKDNLQLVAASPDVLDRWVDLAMQNSLPVQLQRYALSVAEYEIERQKGNRYPTVSLYGRINNEEQGGSLFGGSSEVETTEIGVRFNMNLFEGGSSNSRIREAAYRYNAEMDALHNEMRRATRETRSAFLDLKTSMTKIGSLMKGVDAQQAVVETKRKGYPSLYTNREVLDSERDLYSVKRDLAKARYDYLLADLRLKAAVGSLSEQDFIRINAFFQ